MVHADACEAASQGVSQEFDVSEGSSTLFNRDTQAEIPNKQLNKGPCSTIAEVRSLNTTGSFDPEWVQQNILCLDGGGVRGYSALLILEELMSKIKDLEQGHIAPARSSFDELGYQPPIPQPISITEAYKSSNGRLRSKTKARQTLKVKPEESFYPYHYFDYIFGTSTGGLIAILLGRLRLTVEEALHIYEDFAGEVFGKKRLFSIRSPLLYPRGKYDHRKLEEILKSVVNDAPHVGRSHKFVGGNVFNPDPTFNSEPTLCRTVCVAYMSQGKRKNQPFLFRSYAHADSLNENPDEDSEQAGTRNPGPSHAIPIWKVARATSAAPSYFEPMMIDNHKFLDGALGCNNPSGEAWQELRSMHNGSSKSIGSILSIGTGVSEYDLSGGNGWVKMLQSLSAITKVVTDGLPTHNTMEIVSQSLEFPYLRLAVPGELGDLKMDTWKTDEAQNDETTERSSERRESTAPSAKKTSLPSLAEHRNTRDWIKQQTVAYLQNPDTQKRLREFAKRLVDLRRDRAATSRWAIFASGVRYRCVFPGCSSGHRYKDTEDNLRRHLLKRHFKSGAGGTGLGEEEYLKMEDCIRRGRV